MLPTPSTSHVAFERIYEPAEDSYLLLDTLSSENEKLFLQNRFRAASHSPSPLVLEVGTGSGVVLSFLNAHSEVILGRPDVLTIGIDVNKFACKATEQTVIVAQQELTAQNLSHGFYVGNVLGDLTSSLKAGEVDILVFNPPYVPSPELPSLPLGEDSTQTSFEDDSRLLALSYAGGVDGMETTERLLASLPEILSQQRGCAYILLCAQNKPDKVKDGIKRWGAGWAVETVGTSGKTGGWEKLQIVRVWRTDVK
ncbi:related to methyltransferase S. pombe [Phialocephala subalpina]|uniref:Related to methyltransferase S. pombe n=1 Tax=Phialocephala subalpina TaxID=576137 RepID=A0A1L7WCZ4_9HELO|nr:related to methyltransferase S. pombe [Phialocephala subalpina]